MSEPTNPNCLWCDEEASHDNFVQTTTLVKQDGTCEIRWVHDDCTLRQVLGGIGHLLAHEYWCLQKHDPDAGLTYRQSALLVYQWTRIVGVEPTTEGGSITP